MLRINCVKSAAERNFLRLPSVVKNAAFYAYLLIVDRRPLELFSLPSARCSKISWRDVAARNCSSQRRRHSSCGKLEIQLYSRTLLPWFSHILVSQRRTDEIPRAQKRDELIFSTHRGSFRRHSAHRPRFSARAGNFLRSLVEVANSSAPQRNLHQQIFC